ncbi:MAG: hypothetical protein NZ581_05010 [Candidatus Caldarchaeum sp.]|nr:hypothetical protein [Candidatus Caldarchaeum sp.]MDW8435538.1 hypothetical protein [Candidatus Caldarchaeum sp.]
MSEEEITAVVVAFAGDDCVVSTTTPVDASELSKLVGCEVLYEDFKGDLWKGTVIDVYEGETLLVRFSGEAISQGGPSGLGQGSLVKILITKA